MDIQIIGGLVTIGVAIVGIWKLSIEASKERDARNIEIQTTFNKFLTTLHQEHNEAAERRGKEYSDLLAQAQKHIQKGSLTEGELRATTARLDYLTTQNQQLHTTLHEATKALTGLNDLKEDLAALQVRADKQTREIDELKKMNEALLRENKDLRKDRDSRVAELEKRISILEDENRRLKEHVQDN